MSFEVSIYSLLIVSIIAFLIPFITKRLSIPIIVGEILFGILVGILNKAIENATGTSIIVFTDESGLNFLAELGLIFLLFLAGLEIDINLLQEKGRMAIVLGVVMFTATFALCYAFMWALGFGIYMALVMSTTSVGVVFPILREMKLVKTHVGQDIILGAIIADFGTMMLLPMARFLETHPGADPLHYVWMVVLIACVFAFFLFFFFLGGIAMWKWPRDMAKFFKADDPSELGVRASFLILMAFSAVALTLMGEEGMILGAFLAGVSINFIFREGALLERKLFGFGYGFLIPLFFIKVGVDFTDAISFEGLYILPAFIAIALVVKIIPSIQYIGAVGPRNTLASGFLLSARLSLLIAAVNVGKAYEIKDVVDNEAALIMLALIMCILSPLTFKYLYRPLDEEEEPEEVEPMYELMRPEGDT